MNAEELVAACVARPRDDEPRIAFAEAAGGVRGELVAIQCALARGEMSRAVAIDRRRREAEILRDHGDAFAGLGELASGWELRRGFVESACVDARAFVSRGDELFAKAPLLERVELEGLDGSEAEILERLDAVLASPWFSRVRTLRLVEVGRWVETESDVHPRDFQSAARAVLQRLVDSKAFATLRGLEMPRCGLSESDLKCLHACPEASGLSALVLRHQDVDRYVGLNSSDVAALVDAPCLANIERLDVAGALGHGPLLAGQTRAERQEASRRAADGDAALLRHPRVVALRSLGIAYGGFSEAMIDALANATFTRLDTIDLSRNDVFAEDWSRIAPAPGFAKLRELVFDGPCKYVFDTKMATALGAARGFPSLRTLRIRGSYVRPEAAAALLDSPLAARLELIDLRRNSDLSKEAPSLRKRWDGILLLGDD